MVLDRLRMILTDDELSRLVICDDNPCKISIIADVHGMKCGQARRFINNVINITRQGFSLVVIHGFHHGTAIKNMLASDFNNDRIILNQADHNNPGRTILQLA